MADVRIGISGWTYAPWRGNFFPLGLGQKQELAFASRHVRTIEINGTFYSLQRPSSYAAWYEQTPAGFIFSIKAPRFITHLKRLKNIVAPVANFFASGLLRLNEKLGPILWQLPPNFRYDAKRLTEFFNLLPRTTREAAILARHHDQRLKARAWLRSDEDRPVRHALEVRHASFETDEFIKLLRHHEVALVVADTAGRWPKLWDVTADFIYVRLHGAEELYASGYTPAALNEWKKWIEVWSAGEGVSGARLPHLPLPRRAVGRDVFVYFDNDAKAHAPFDAMALAHLLDPVSPVAPLAGAHGDEPIPKKTARKNRRGFMARVNPTRRQENKV